MTEMNYAEIKRMAAELKTKTDNLLALSPNNDPFYTGRPSEMAASEWFRGLWLQFGYSDSIHLRRIHYQIVANANINMPSGEIYENTQQCWSFLTMASKWARYLGLVDPDRFVDRRNPEAIIFSPTQRENAEPYANFDNWLYQSDFNVPTPANLPDMPSELPEFSSPNTGGLSPIQPYLIEVWAEKTTMNDVLEPLCQKYGCNLVTGAGELSITAVRQFLQRAVAVGKKARILYVSDFDPAGLGMPVSVARKVEYYQRNGSWEEQELDVALQPIVLTEDQVNEWNLPRVPVKDSDMRKGNFEAAHGVGQVELDALEALHPGELERIVTGWIEQFYDTTLQDEVEDRLRNLRSYAREILSDVTDGHSVSLEELQDEWEDVVVDYNDIRQELLDTVQPIIAKLQAVQERSNDIYNRLTLEYSNMRQDAMDMLDLGPYKNPIPYTPDDDPEVLYHSRLDYFDQLAKYKAHKYGTGE